MCIFLYPPGYSSFNLRRTVRAYVMILLIYHVGEWVVLHLVFFVEMLCCCCLFCLKQAGDRCGDRSTDAAPNVAVAAESSREKRNVLGAEVVVEAAGVAVVVGTAVVTVVMTAAGAAVVAAVVVGAAGVAVVVGTAVVTVVVTAAQQMLLS